MFLRNSIQLTAIVATLFLCSETNAQSGSRNIVPSVQSPVTSSSTVLQSQAGSVMVQAVPAQPFSSDCPNCQMGGNTSATSVMTPTTSYGPTITQQTTGTYITPPATTVYSNPIAAARVLRAPSCSTPVYSRPIQVYRPVSRNYYPLRRVYRSSCGGY